MIFNLLYFIRIKISAEDKELIALLVSDKGRKEIEGILKSIEYKFYTEFISFYLT